MQHFERKSYRIKGFNYGSEGWYFITICTIDKKHVFGKIKNDIMTYSKIGLLTKQFLMNISKVYDDIYLDKYVIMPNHIHMVVSISEMSDVNISRVIKHFKEGITKQLGYKIWQKSFYDHVIRNETDYLRIYEYIDENVLKWSLDKYYDE